MSDEFLIGAEAEPARFAFDGCPAIFFFVCGSYIPEIKGVDKIVEAKE